MIRRLLLTMLVGAVPLSVAQASEPSGDSLYHLDLAWSDDQGKQVRLDSLRGRPVVLSLVYTYCAATCPLTVQKLKKIEARLGKARTEVAYVLVSMDPARDTPETLAQFRTRYQLSGKKNWYLFSGSLDDTRTLAAALGFRFTRNAESQDFMHDNKVFLLSADGVLVNTIATLDEGIDQLVEAARATARK